ncbi:spindle assembly abnormal protein 6 homolog [Microplitis mediator]|uniref:spindle assembly abnormal protein 6 homolog n=1 Tax=Microplitis mediator TaxID=375433 RepID=UPI00255403B5|nr:spindle assembly abnormal protein 6 homolog [Microplitis mediator]
MYRESFTELLYGIGIFIFSQIICYCLLYFLGLHPINGKYWNGKVDYRHKKNLKSIVKEDDKDDKDDKQKHVQFERTFQISSDINVQKENLQQATQSKPVTEKLEPRETPTKSTKNVVERHVNKTKESKDVKEGTQIGGDKDERNVSLLMPLVQKSKLSWSNIQILIDSLLKLRLDNPGEVTESTGDRADLVKSMKKKHSKKNKALFEKYKAGLTYQNKLNELRTKLKSERSRLTDSFKQLEKALNAKVTEAQTLHTCCQYIFDDHAAEKQEFVRQIKQLQTKSNAVGATIHKKQEDQGWTQGHHQQKLLAQCKQQDMMIAEIDSIKSLLKSQLTQKQMKFDQLQGNHITVTQDQTATCDSSSNKIEMLKQQFGMMQEQFMHLERRLQSLCGFEVNCLEIVRQLKELHHAITNLDHLSKNPHRHEQELQNGDKKSSAVHLEMIQIQEENERLEDMQRTQKNGQIDDLQSDLIKAKVESLQREASNHSSFTERLQDDLEALRLKNNNEAIGACSSLDQSVNGPSSECIKPEQVRTTTLLPGMDETLITNLESEICSITSIKPAIESQQDLNCNSFIFGLNSDNLHTSTYARDVNYDPQQKRRKKNRKINKSNTK